jgi:hypothetical protein
MIGARDVFALVVAFAGAPAATAFASVVADGDEIGVKTVQLIGLPLPIESGLVFRPMAMMHFAMLPATLTSYLGALPDGEVLGASFVIRRGWLLSGASGRCSKAV